MVEKAKGQIERSNDVPRRSWLLWRGQRSRANCQGIVKASVLRAGGRIGLWRNFSLMETRHCMTN